MAILRLTLWASPQVNERRRLPRKSTIRRPKGDDMAGEIKWFEFTDQCLVDCSPRSRVDLDGYSRGNLLELPEHPMKILRRTYTNDGSGAADSRCRLAAIQSSMAGNPKDLRMFDSRDATGCIRCWSASRWREVLTMSSRVSFASSFTHIYPINNLQGLFSLGCSRIEYLRTLGLRNPAFSLPNHHTHTI